MLFNQTGEIAPSQIQQTTKVTEVISEQESGASEAIRNGDAVNSLLGRSFKRVPYLLPLSLLLLAIGTGTLGILVKSRLSNGTFERLHTARMFRGKDHDSIRVV